MAVPSFLESLLKHAGGGGGRKTSRKSKCSPFKQCVGSKIQVYHGTAEKTSGGVKRSGITKKPDGRLVFAAKSAAARKSNNLVKSGYGSIKGRFGAIDIKTGKPVPMRKTRKSRRTSRKSRK